MHQNNAPYETTSTLAPWPSPEVVVAERHAVVPSHSSLPPNLRPVVRPFGSSTRSAFGTGLQACCGLHGCLHQGLGGHVQRACSVGGLDGSPTALAHQLPRVAGSTSGLEPSQETLTRRAHTGPYRQHCDRRIHQPIRWSTLPSHVATRPPPPPLESEASEVASRHSHSVLAQLDSRRAALPESGDSIPRWSSWFGDGPTMCPRFPLLHSEPGGEPASAAPWGGRPSSSFGLSRQSIEIQDLRPALCLPRSPAEGNAISKQRMAHWIVVSITLAYQTQGVPCPFRLRAHTTRSVGSSWALARGTLLTDICRAAGWPTPNTFAPSCGTGFPLCSHLKRVEALRGSGFRSAC